MKLQYSILLRWIRSGWLAALALISTSSTVFGLAFDFNGNLRWTGGVIPYVIDSNVSSENLAMIDQAMLTWQKAANINFVKRTTEADYVKIAYTFLHDVNFSYVAKSGGEQPMWVNNWTVHTVTHELGHTLGCCHEHQRWDRDDYLTIGGYIPGTDINYTKLDGGFFAFGALSDNRTTYDYYSIMQYGRKGFPLPWVENTIVPKYLTVADDPTGNPYATNFLATEELLYIIGVDYLDTDDLSPLDKQGIASEYGAPGFLSGAIVVDGTSVPNAAAMPTGIKIKLTGTGKTVEAARRLSPNPLTVNGPSVNISYAFEGTPTGSYTVTPSKAGYYFTPRSRTVTVANGTDITFVISQFETTPPTLAVTAPLTNGSAYQNAPTVTGTAADAGSGVAQVRVALFREQDGVWYDFVGGTWGTENFSFSQNMVIASGTTSWSHSLPGLTDGGYSVHAQAVDAQANGSDPWDSRNFSIDNVAPKVTVFVPASDTPYQTVPQAQGVASDENSSVREVRVAIFNEADGKWWHWNANDWGSPTFDFATHVRLATDLPGWRANLPNLGVGNYQIHVQSVDMADNGSTWEFSRFSIDQTAPIVAFTGFTNQQHIFNFSQLFGSISEPGTVTFRITEYNFGTPDRYWNAYNWVTNNDVTVENPTALTGLNWSPAAYAPLPTRAQTRAGYYLVDLTGKDIAGNTATTNIVLYRSAPDTTLPELSFFAPTNGQVFTNNSLPYFGGISSDLESELAAVDLSLYRLAAPSQYEYWNGLAWVSYSTNLVTAHDNNFWSAPTGYNFPSGANLPNRSYSVQVTARNNEVPPMTRSISVNFSVEYHPVFLWTAGSFSDLNPNNNNNHWDNPANWDAGEVPPPSAVVVINAGAPDNTSMGSVNIYGVNLAGGTLTTSGMLINKLNLSGGSLAGGAITLATNGVFNWSNGAVSGLCTIRPGATLNLSGPTAKTLGAGTVLDNEGTINWAGPGVIYNYGLNLADRATIRNQANAVFNVSTDGQVFSHDYSESLFFNLPGGQLVKSGGTNFTSFNNFVLFNSGELRVESGAILFDGTCTLDPGTTLAGSGAVRLLGASAIQCPISGTANLRLEAGTLTASGPAAYTGSAGMDWLGGTLVGTMEIAPGSSLRISGAATKQLGSGAVLNNRGATTWAGPGVIYNYGLNPGDRATINNLANGSFTILTDGQVFAHDYNLSWFNNQAGAQFRKAGGPVVTLINHFIFNNAGEINAATGTLEFNDALNLGGGGRLTGAGQFLISNGTATLSNLTTIAEAGVTMTAGTLFGDPASSGGLATTNGGSFNWAGGALVGAVNIAPGGAFKISGAAQKTMGSGAILNNAGMVTWSGSGDIYNYGLNLADRATINNHSGASFHITSNAVFSFTYNPSLFNNASNATFAKIDGGGVTTSSWRFNNAGAASCTSGTLALAGGGNSGGRFDAGTAALVRFTGGTHSLSNGSTFTGGGRVQIDGATLLHDGALTLGLPAQPLALDLLNGELGGNGTLPGKYVLTWTGGTIGGNQTIMPDGAVVVTNTGFKTLGSGAVLNNLGSITWFGPGTIYNYGLAGGDPATINNQSNALFIAAADGQVFHNDYSPSLFNNLPGARFVKSAGTNFTSINHWLFNSPGEVRAETGSLLFDYFVTLGPNARLTGNGTVRLAGNATLSGTLNSTGNLRLEAGLLTGVSTATYTGGGGFEWTGGMLGGGLTLAPANGLAINGAARKDLGAGAILNNQGTITWAGPGTIYNYGLAAGDPATINNQSGAQFIAATDGQVFSHDYTPSTFNNFSGARLTKSAGPNSTSINNFVFNSPGEVRVESGSMVFDGQATFGPAGSLTGSGTIRWAGDIRLSGVVSSTVNANLEGGGLTGNSNATFSGAGPLNWTAGTLAGNITLAPGSTLNLSGGAKFLASAAVLNNQGTVNWSGPGTLYNYGLNLTDCATFNNLAGGVFNLTTDGSVFSYDYNPSYLNNAPGAKLRKTGGPGSSSISYTFANSGAVEVLAGTLNFAGSYASSSASSELNLVLSGLTPGTEFTRLTANGNLPFDGALKVTLAGGFTPTNGQSFAVVGYGSRTGQFTGLQLPPLSAGSVWLVDYSPTAVTLLVQPATGISNMLKAAGGSFQFDIVGPAASRCVIFASTNVVDWIPISTNLPFTGSFHFNDPSAAELPRRFYQIRIEP